MTIEASADRENDSNELTARDHYHLLVAKTRESLTATTPRQHRIIMIAAGRHATAFKQTPLIEKMECRKSFKDLLDTEPDLGIKVFEVLKVHYLSGAADLRRELGLSQRVILRKAGRSVGLYMIKS